MHTSLRASSAIAYTPRPATAGRGRGPTRQRWEGEGRPIPSCRAARENGGSLAARHCEERDNRDAPHPPIASQWAPPSPRFAGERCMDGAWPETWRARDVNPIATTRRLQLTAGRAAGKYRHDWSEENKG